ncbi:MAG: hypothetical protein Q8R06_12420 [Polaromonas sp.]|uniref:hypothetical protein n=1 Tax=Polaromonas sp. TaxID=1869339 RepID=UPI002734695D|nr:hypothetical protein [Polaromonas sp.]MDP3797936.1 hypothetical protein [Polaromonas sp.]
MKDDLKARTERSIFHAFAERYRADVDRHSIATGDPNEKEPDIVAKSTEGYIPIAVELVQLGEFQDTEAPAAAGTASAPSATGLSIAAFTKKFSNVRQGRYARFQPGDLELLAYTDHLLTPWPVVLAALTQWLEQEAAHDAFARVWIWKRPTRAGDGTEGVWLWTAGRPVEKFA